MPSSLMDMNANNGCANLDDFDSDNLESPNYFPLLSLAPEIISNIISHFNQLQILPLRLVCRQLKNLTDELYGFRFNIYDEPDRLAGIRKFKCQKITIWKLIQPLQSHLLDCPTFLKIIEVSGPITPANLQLLISPCVNLERLSIVRRANYPWVLNLRDTPALLDLKKLKHLLLNCEETAKSDRLVISLPLMDTHFPNLTSFDIVKGFQIAQYSSYVSSLLKFIGRHHQTLSTLRLCMLPRRNLCFFPPDGAADVSDQHQTNNRLDLQMIDLRDLCRVNVKKLSVTTQGYAQDLKLWEQFLENQAQWEDFRFDWCRIDSPENPVQSGFPWILYEAPILKSAETLVAVELNNVAMLLETPGGTKQLIPFNLGLFSNCKRLENLSLVNYFNSSHVDQEIDESFVVNGMDLPSSLLAIRLEGLKTKTEVLEGILEKCWQLECVTFKGLGGEGEFGVRARTVREMLKLFYLKNLQIENFNRDVEQDLVDLFAKIDLPYESGNAWIRLWNGPVMARDVLRRMNS